MHEVDDKIGEKYTLRLLLEGVICIKKMVVLYWLKYGIVWLLVFSLAQLESGCGPCSDVLGGSCMPNS